MKTIILILSLMIAVVGKSQDSIRQLSKYENFISNTGVLTKATEQEVDKVGDIKISFHVATNVQTGANYKSVSINQLKTFLLTPISVGILSIDIDELPGFINALRYVQGQLSTKPDLSTSFYYSTNNGVTLSANYTTSGFTKGWSVGFGQVYKYSRMSIANSTILLKKKELDDVEMALQKTLKL